MGVLKPLVITGPTGSGKSALALEVGRRTGATIISMDAMQVYRGFDVGTAKVSPVDRDVSAGGVYHKCIDVVSAEEAFTAQDFATHVNDTSGPVVLCGGSTFYLRAWEEPLIPSPAVDPALRARLASEVDPHRLLSERDPVLAARLHPNDHVRIIRGLEYQAQTGERLSDAHARDSRTRKDSVALWIDRDDLYEGLDARVNGMLGCGYLDEVAGLLSVVPRTAKPMMSFGYVHLVAYILGELSFDEAVRLTKRDTRNFARKQRGFLRQRFGAPTRDVSRLVGDWGA